MNSNIHPQPAQPVPWLGILVGLCAASIGALYTVFARQGLAQGLAPWDLTFLRFAVAGVLTLPILAIALYAKADALRKQWRIWLAVAVLAGPLFGLLMFGALHFAPASHAAVFPFTAMSVMGMLMGAIFLGDRITLRRIAGVSIVIVGLVVLAGLSSASLQGSTLLGDLLFITAGTMWAGFGILLRKYQLNPLLATAVISFVALITYVPLYWLITGAQTLTAASLPTVLTQVLVQGVIAGVGTLYTYGKMVSILGPSRAAIFPALAPGIAALLAWPVLNHLPNAAELTGLALAVLGLVVSVTTFRLMPSAFSSFLSKPITIAS
jgi:drug/metabolite transporter (DMT)-like permease